MGSEKPASYVPSEQVKAVVGVHNNQLTAEIGLAIERLLNLEAANEVSAEGELKLKVHEEVEGGNTRVSIYIRLEFGPKQAGWKKIRKVKKIS